MFSAIIKNGFNGFQAQCSTFDIHPNTNLWDEESRLGCLSLSLFWVNRFGKDGMLIGGWVNICRRLENHYSLGHLEAVRMIRALFRQIFWRTWGNNRMGEKASHTWPFQDNRRALCLETYLELLWNRMCHILFVWDANSSQVEDAH